MIFFALPALAGELTIPYERFTLDNGLEVVLHQDRSDPIVAIATLVHVGSSREVPGRTGFAHFFEHMSFNDSENVPRGANRKRIEELGGNRNGGTNRDQTIYYEVVPSDALEKLLWIDSDRLGYMINTVTEGALENEKQVVKNEKRERNDNAPYGHAYSVISANLYPADHPYHWPVIGSLADLQAATLTDVRTFYDRWYGPNNATLVLAGDFEIEPTKELIRAYFGEIPRGPEVEKPAPQPVTLEASKSLKHLDSFARLPDLMLAFPTVEQFHEDSYALDALGEILSDGKRAALYRELVEKRQIAQYVAAWNNADEIAGAFTIRVRANPGVDLDEVKAGVDAALADFAANGFDPADLDRIKARQERQFYEGIQSVLDKAFSLATYQAYRGDPGFLTEDLARTKAVTADDVKRVFSTWVEARPYVMTSFVPKDAPELAVEGAETAAVVEEEVVKGAEAPPAVVTDGDYEKTPTVFDRSSEPALGEPSTVEPPAVVHSERPDGMGVWVIEQHELPLVQFSVSFDGGHRTEPIERSGLTALLAGLMNEGTRGRTPEELEDALGQLGADLRVSGERDGIVLRGSCLASQFDTVFALAVEMLTEPRFDPVEFERVYSEQLASLEAREGSAQSIAGLALNRELYGPDHIYGWPTDGTRETVAPIGLKDLKKRYKQVFSTRVANLQVVGDLDVAAAERAGAALAAGLRTKAVAEPAHAGIPESGPPEVVFVDIPGSKQSVLYAGSVAMSPRDPAWFDLDVAHRRLGGGSSAQLFQTLRIAKGYTYGAYSFASARSLPGPFGMTTSVRANVTLESLQILRDLVTGYADTFDEGELDITRTVITKGESVDFETLDARLRYLETLSAYGLPPDLMARRQARLAELGVDDVRATIGRWMAPERLVWIVVGDGETQRAELEKFGLPVREVSAASLNGEGPT
ncbi:MAG: pitrilysin family protein [Myxococcota bacterium]